MVIADLAATRARRRYDYIERSGGIFRDMTIHDFDVARWLLGEEVEDRPAPQPRCWSTPRSASVATSTAPMSS